MRVRAELSLIAASLLPAVGPLPLAGQDGPAEVIQLVTFRFAPGEASEAIRIFRDEAVPLYVRNPDMLEFRAYREVESPEPLDLVVISRFRGMAGMDASNQALRRLATEDGSSIGAIYGSISRHTLGHTDEFVEITTGEALASMDGAELVVLESLAVGGIEVPAAERLPGGVEGVRGGLAGRFLVGSGWDRFRMYGVDDLGTVQAVASDALFSTPSPVRSWRRMVLASVPELSVR